MDPHNKIKQTKNLLLFYNSMNFYPVRIGSQNGDEERDDGHYSRRADGRTSYNFTNSMVFRSPVDEA